MITIEGTKINFKSAFGETTFDLADFAYIDTANLQREYVEQPGWFAYIGALSAEAKKNAFLAKMNKEQAWATAYRVAKDRLEIEGKKPTENMTESTAILDPEYIAARTALAEAEWEEDLVGIMLKAFDQRAQMLISLGSDMRQERNQTGMTIKDPGIEKVKGAATKK